MARLFAVILLVLLPFAPSQAQDLPPQFALALASLSSFLGRPVTVSDLDNWSYTQNLYTDTALGCPYVFPQPRPEGISGLTFLMVYQGVTYDYRVSVNGSIIFPCIQEGGGPIQQPQTTSTPSNCPSGFVNYLPPRLEVGGTARLAEGGTPNRLRDAPSVGGTQIGTIQPGTTVDVLEGPTCEEVSHIIWWRVSDDGVVGWTAEGQMPNDYFLSPVQSSLPAERDLIALENVDTLIPLTALELGGVTSISFTADSRLVALGGLSGLSVYDMTTLTLVTNLSDVNTAVTAVAFSPDGRYLAYSTQTGALILNDTTAGTHTTLAQVPASNRINTVTFNASSTYLLVYGSGSPSGTIGTTSGWVAYDLPATTPLINMPTASWVRDIAISPDDTLIGWLDTSAHVQNADQSGTPRAIPLEDPATGVGMAGGSLAWRPSPVGTQPEHQVAFVDGASVRLVNLDANTEQSFVGDADFEPSAIAFSTDGTLLAVMNVPGDATSTSTINIFAADTGDLITSTPLGGSRALVFSPDGTLLVVGSNDEVLFLGIDNSEIAAG
jgi:WD40 repeat protein